MQTLWTNSSRSSLGTQLDLVKLATYIQGERNIFRGKVHLKNEINDANTFHKGR